MTPQEKQKWTTERQKRFWEACGLRKELATDGKEYWFIGEDSTLIYLIGNIDNNGDPCIDPNNLFKWAVPKLQELGFGYCLSDSQAGLPHHCDIYGGYKEESREIIYAHITNDDPALALAEAIEKALIGE